MKRSILIPFCTRTGGIPHWTHVQPPDEPNATEGGDFGLVWREAASFVPKGPVEAVSWERGRSAANLVLGGPVLGRTRQRIEVRATFYLTQRGVLQMLQGGAFDGPQLRAGALQLPVKRGQNYLVEFGGFAEVRR